MSLGTQRVQTMHICMYIEHNKHVNSEETGYTLQPDSCKDSSTEYIPGLLLGCCAVAPAASATFPAK